MEPLTAERLGTIKGPSNRLDARRTKRSHVLWHSSFSFRARTACIAISCSRCTDLDDDRVCRYRCIVIEWPSVCESENGIAQRKGVCTTATMGRTFKILALIEHRPLPPSCRGRAPDGAGTVCRLVIACPEMEGGAADLAPGA